MGTTRPPGRPRSQPLTPFGEKLRELIAASDFKNRSRFIKALGADPATVHRWETTGTDPGWTYLSQVAALLKVDPMVFAPFTKDPGELGAVERVWAEFEKTAVFRDAKAATIRTMRSIPWRDGIPTVDVLRSIATALDTGMIANAQEAADSVANEATQASKAAKRGVVRKGLRKKS